MRYIELNSNDIFLNLATEEYVFQNYTDDSYLLLYKNDDSIVLGKYQNAYQEVNVPEAEELGMKIARRITGGGTVFHDKGNLNYSFITENTKTHLRCYDDFLFPVIHALQAMGIDAHKRNTCDIAIGDLKISGSAQSVRGNRILHHGTLLFDADMDKLHRLLKVTDAVIESKAVASVPSHVTNIREHLKDPSMTIEEFQDALLAQIFPSGISFQSLSSEDMQEIYRLCDEKYGTWEWNWGKSPRFILRRDGVELSVEHGIIKKCHVSAMSSEIEASLVGQRYGYNNMLQILSAYFGEDTKSIVNQMF